MVAEILSGVCDCRKKKHLRMYENSGYCFFHSIFDTVDGTER